MGNRFSTLVQYHGIVKAHAIMGAMVFLLIVPFSVMIVRFYSLHPGYAVVYHAQMQVFAALMLLVVFILGFFAVGPERNLSNPHHGIGLAIFIMFALQIIGGRLVRNIVKARSLRIMIHQWSGRTIALLGIIQVPLGLTLYGSPKYLFVLYALWMTFLFIVYFVLSFRAAGRRDMHMSGGRSEAGHTRYTESEIMSDHQEKKHSGIWKWLGPLAAVAGVWALMSRKKNRDKERDEREHEHSRPPSHYRSDATSRRDSDSYYDEKSEYEPKKKSGGGFLKLLGGAAAAVGAGKLASNFMNRRKENREDEYSAVSTETPRRHRPARSEMSDSYYTDDYGRSEVAHDTRYNNNNNNRPTAPGASYRNDSRRDFAESDYSSYASPSRRDTGKPGGVGKGILAGLGMGWLASKFSGRKNRQEEERLRDERMREEEEMRIGNQGPKFTGDGHPSPTRTRPQNRRTMGYPGESELSSDLTETTMDSRPTNARPQSTPYVPVPVPVPVTPTHGRSRSNNNIPSANMPSMPDDPHGIFHSELDGSSVAPDARPQRRGSSRRRAAADRAAARAAERASSLAADEERTYRPERDRYASPSSQPVSVKLQMHDDRDRNVTLRRLTEEEAMAARGRRDSISSLSGSPSSGRGYRRGSAQQRAESAAEQRVEEGDRLTPLSPPNPAFARGRRAKDSAYYSGQPGPSGSIPGAGQTVSSLGTQDTHGTWSGMSQTPSGHPQGSESAAADNRRRRRQERRQASGSRPATGVDMFD